MSADDAARLLTVVTCFLATNALGQRGNVLAAGTGLLPFAGAQQVARATAAEDAAWRQASLRAAEAMRVEIETAKKHVKQLDLRWVVVPAGEFRMGCSTGDKECEDNERPDHAIRITRPFRMMATEVTAGQFRTWALSQGYEPPGQPEWTAADVPVVNVTWNDAQAFCSAFGARLPTEAEWEYAARGGSKDARYGPIGDIAWYGGNSGSQAHPVAGKKPNAFGLHDMLGNVLERCGDWYEDEYYKERVDTDPAGPSSGHGRVVRGGAWLFPSSHARASFRSLSFQEMRSDFVGFRCIRGASSTVAVPVLPNLKKAETPKEFNLRWVAISAGEFEMGCSTGDEDCSDPEKPNHTVRITKPFRMTATEVTAGQFRTWALSQGYEPPGQPEWTEMETPVVNVTWADAQAFCSTFGGRLPTEAEWEYAARAGAKEAWYGPIGDVAWYGENSGKRGGKSFNRSQPVAGKKPNAFGLYDMLGNVLEWCRDWYDDEYVQGAGGHRSGGPLLGQEPCPSRRLLDPWAEASPVVQPQLGLAVESAPQRRLSLPPGREFTHRGSLAPRPEKAVGGAGRQPARTVSRRVTRTACWPSGGTPYSFSRNFFGVVASAPARAQPLRARFAVRQRERVDRLRRGAPEGLRALRQLRARRDRQAVGQSVVHGREVRVREARRRRPRRRARGFDSWPSGQRGAHRHPEVRVVALRVAHGRAGGAERALEDVHRVAVREVPRVAQLLEREAVRARGRGHRRRGPVADTPPLAERQEVRRRLHPVRRALGFLGVGGREGKEEEEEEIFLRMMMRAMRPSPARRPRATARRRLEPYYVLRIRILLRIRNPSAGGSRGPCPRRRPAPRTRSSDPTCSRPCPSP